MQHKAISFITIIFFVFSVITGLMPEGAEAGIFSRSVSRVAAHKAAARQAAKKSVAKKTAKTKASHKSNYKKVLAHDAARDKKTVAKPLEKSRTVRRYTSAKNARTAKKNGVPAGSHMTSRTPKGRPISAKTARKRYGLNNKPEARITIQIPKGQPVKKNKVIGGKPGWGEITSTKPIQPKDVKRVDIFP